MSCVQGYPAQPTWVAQMHDTLFRNVGRHQAQLAARQMGPAGLGLFPSLPPQDLLPPEPSTMPPQESHELAALRSPALPLLPARLAAARGTQSGDPGVPGLLQQQHQQWARPAGAGLCGGQPGGDQDGRSSFMSWTQEGTRLDPRETGRLAQGLQGGTTQRGQVGTRGRLGVDVSPQAHLVQSGIRVASPGGSVWAQGCRASGLCEAVCSLVRRQSS